MYNTLGFMSISVIAVIGFFSAFLLTKAFRRFAIANGIVDIPNCRSSHLNPVPRGAGIAIVTITISLFFVASLTSFIGTDTFFALFISGLITGLIGFYDDVRDAHPLFRLVLHFLAAWCAYVVIPVFPEIQIFDNRYYLYGGFAGIVTIIGLVWMLNLYNFMDGIDGIASVEAVTVSLSAFVLLFYIGAPGLAFTSLLVAVAVLGFLVWNWPPAKVFMGDVGSGYLGITFGILALTSAAESEITLWVWFILLSAFITDSTYTVLVRAFTGQRVYEGHRSHVYQILARRFKSHRPVVIGLLIYNVIWLFPLAFLATVSTEHGGGLFLLSTIPVILMGVMYRAGIQND